MSDPFAAARAQLAGKHSPANAKPTSADPFAAARAQVKVGKGATKPASNAPPAQPSGPLSDRQLDELYQQAIASAHPHVVALKAIYEAGRAAK